jgi:hypothetical protein
MQLKLPCIYILLFFLFNPYEASHMLLSYVLSAYIQLFLKLRRGGGPPMCEQIMDKATSKISGTEPKAGEN